MPSGSAVISEVGEHVGGDPLQLAQAGDGQPADLDVGVLGGAHRDEVPPGAVVAGDDDARLGGVGQHRARGLPGLLAAQRGVLDVGELLLQALEQLGVGGCSAASAAARNSRAAPGPRRSRPARPSRRRARGRSAARAGSRRSAGAGSARG